MLMYHIPLETPYTSDVDIIFCLSYFSELFGLFYQPMTHILFYTSGFSSSHHIKNDPFILLERVMQVIYFSNCLYTYKQLKFSAPVYIFLWFDLLAGKYVPELAEVIVDKNKDPSLFIDLRGILVCILHLFQLM